MSRVNISDFVVEFNSVPYERKSIPRILWGYPDLDYYTKGIERGLTILEADTNMGKSILTMQVLQNVSRQGYKTCVFASEHTNESFKMLVMQQNGTRGHFKPVTFKDTSGRDTNIVDWYVDDETENKVEFELGKNLVLFNSQKKERDMQTIIDWIEYCRDFYNCKFCLIDNFTEIDSLNRQNVFQEQTEMITLLRDTLLRLDMMGVLVMHINKASASESFRLTVKSASGTANAGNKAYNVLALYRKDCIFVNEKNKKQLERFIQDCAKCGFDYEQCDGFIEVVKTKGNGNGVIGLTYDKATKTYHQAPKITKTEADMIYRKYEENKQIELTEVNDDELPWLGED